MLSRLFSLQLLLVFGLYLTSCTTDSPSDDGDDNPTTSTASNFVTLDGGSYSLDDVTFDSTTTLVEYVFNGSLSQLSIEGNVSFGKRAGVNADVDVSLKMVFRDSLIGAYPWSERSDLDPTDILTLTIGSDAYFPVVGPGSTGSIAISKFESTLTGEVVGTFSGSVVSPTSGETIVLSNGRFRGFRNDTLPAFNPTSPEDYDLYFILNGSGFSDDTVKIFPSVGTAFLEDDNGPYFDIILSGGTVTLPGKAPTSFRVSIEFPGDKPGIINWGGTEKSTLNMTIGGDGYEGVNGETELSTMGILDMPFTGRFTGIVEQNGGGDSISVTEGWFKGTRKK